MSKRDPRIDPVGGDVVRGWVVSDAIERRVIYIKNGTVTYSSSAKNSEQKCNMETWREWCRRTRARVIPRSAMQHARRA